MIDEEALKSWWIDKGQIGLSEAAVNALKEEGIEEPMYLADLSKEIVDTLVQNLKKVKRGNFCVKVGVKSHENFKLRPN